MASTQFGEVLQKRLKDAGKTQQDIAKKMGVSEATISNFNATERLQKVDTVYRSMIALFPILISEHVLISPEHVQELVNLIPFKPFKDDSEKRIAKQARIEIEKLALARLKERQALDRPRYYTNHTEFIGRQEDIDEIIAILLSPHSRVRIINIVGLPGVGKTELAEQITARDPIQEHFNTISMFLKNSKMSMAAVLNTILEEASRSLTDAKRRLVILQDCEVIEDTSNAQRELITFLNEHKQFTILATSRRPFHLGSEIEHVHVITPLKVPKDDDIYTLSFGDLQAYEAIELFRQAAEGNDKKFTFTEQNIKTVAVICQVFDGLPLALLIAAAWVKHEPIDYVYEWIKENGFLDARYRTVTEWHETLNLLIEKSYNLLAKEEQKLLRWMSAFMMVPGNWTGR